MAHRSLVSSRIRRARAFSASRFDFPESSSSVYSVSADTLPPRSLSTSSAQTWGMFASQAQRSWPLRVRGSIP